MKKANKHTTKTSVFLGGDTEESEDTAELAFASDSASSLDEEPTISDEEEQRHRRHKKRKGKRVSNKASQPASPSLAASALPIVPIGGPSVLYPAKGRCVKGFTEIEPPREEFRRVVGYRFYRLTNQSTRYAAEDARRISRQVRAMRHSFHTTPFDGSDPILVLSFLRNFRDAANNDGSPRGLLPLGS